MGQEKLEAPGQGRKMGTLDVLRTATAAAHARIEGVLALEGPFPWSHYVRVLQGFHAFLPAWEPVLAAALPQRLHSWFESRRRSPLVARDLATLSISPAAIPVRLPVLADAAAALGSLYVLEGSALGGQVIAQRLRRWHGIGAEDGAAYFTGWGERTGPMWREFQQLLAREVTDPASQHAACLAAVATFDALAATFEACLHEPAAA